MTNVIRICLEKTGKSLPGIMKELADVVELLVERNDREQLERQERRRSWPGFDQDDESSGRSRTQCHNLSLGRLLSIKQPVHSVSKDKSRDQGQREAKYK